MNFTQEYGILIIFGIRILRKRFSPNIFAVIIFALSKDKEVNKPDNVTDRLAW